MHTIDDTDDENDKNSKKSNKKKSKKSKNKKKNEYQKLMEKYENIKKLEIIPFNNRKTNKTTWLLITETRDGEINLLTKINEIKDMKPMVNDMKKRGIKVRTRRLKSLEMENQL
eukprot:257270_1